MAEAAEAAWAPIYVLGAGWKKMNGAYISAGNYAGRLRYKHPKELVWAFFAEEKEMWVFMNKSRYLGDGKCMYRNKTHTEMDDPIPMSHWKYHSSPGCNPAPRVINSAFVVGEEVDVFSKKANKWMPGKVMKVNESKDKSRSGTYKCQIKGVRKQINIKRDQLRMLEESRYTTKQFVEIKTKSGDWMLAMIGIVKEGGKYYVVLPDGKGATFPEVKIRPTEMCRGVEEPAAPAPVSPEAGKAPAAAASDGNVQALLAEKDQQIADLHRKIANLENAAASDRKSSFSEDTMNKSGADPQLVSQILKKQEELENVVTDLRNLLSKLH